MKVLDVHCHFSIETGRVASDAKEIGFAVENKSIEEHLAFMDSAGIAYAILSCPTQKYQDDPAACAAYCRAVNDLGAKLCREHPDRFAFAAALPLPDVTAAIAELRRAVTELGAKAVGLCSNYAGMYLGDPALEPLFDALQTLGVPALLHPAAPQEFPKRPVTGRVLPMFEFITDTTRTLLDLFDAETLNRHPGVRLVVPHSGSCLPVALDRFYGICAAQQKQRRVPLEQLYFDLACDAFPRGAKILQTLTDNGHIVYGTDFPAIPTPTLQRHIANARTCPEFAGAEADVLWNNAAKLFGIV